MGWLGYHGVRAFSDLVKGELAPTQPRGDDYLLPDERARQRACAALAADAAIDTARVEVRVLSGVLELRGSVPDSATKARVEQLCTGLPGVASVANDLSIG
ncbi:MAG: BON domain-containing protein [Polyangiales bacterium]